MTNADPSPLVAGPYHLRFANDIDRMVGSISELQDLTNRLIDRARDME